MNLPVRPPFIATLAALALCVSFSGCKRQPAPVDDATLNTTVQNKIAGDPALGGEPIQISTANGIVTLSGSVDSDAARSAAANDAMQVPGLRVLNNNLTVLPPVAAAAAPAAAPAPMPMPMPTPALPGKKTKPSAAAPQPPASPYQPAPIQAPAPIVQNTPPPPPPAPARPVTHTFTLPAGTVLPVRTTEAMDSGSTQQGTAFHGVLVSDVFDANNNVVFTAGTPVTGQVKDVQDAAHFKGSSLLSIAITSASFRGDHIPLSTEPYTVEGKGRGKNTAEKIGGGAIVGGILGGILGGGKGAAIGMAGGGALGAGANAATKGQQVSIPSESVVKFKLTSAVSVTR